MTGDVPNVLPRDGKPGLSGRSLARQKRWLGEPESAGSNPAVLTILEVRFSFKTIERWWYIARGAVDPLGALARKVPSHAGTHPSLHPLLIEAIAKQHHDHPRWSFQLHYDNLLTLAREEPRLGPVPSYPTLCRFMKEQGLLRARKHRRREHPDGEPFVARETRSYEVTHVHGLWHLDFHEGSRPLPGTRRVIAQRVFGAAVVAYTPVTGAAPTMRNRKDVHMRLEDDEHDTVRKSLHFGGPDVRRSHHRKGVRRLRDTNQHGVDRRDEATATTGELALVPATVGFELARRAGREPNQPSSFLRNSSQRTPGSSPDRAACARRSISSVSSREMPAGASRESSNIAASSSRSSGGKARAS